MMLPSSIFEKDATIRIKTKDGKICPFFFADTPMAKRLSGISQIMHDLEHAKELMSLVRETDNEDIAYSLWMSAVVTYGKCFASAAGRRIKLELKHVKRFNEAAVDYHNALLTQRNQYFAHAGENDFEAANVGVILAPEEDGKEVLWVNHIMFKKNGISPDEIELFMALCDGLYSVTEKMGEKVHELVLDEYRAMDIAVLYTKAYEKT